MIGMVIDKLTSFYDRISDLRKENRKLADDALRAVSHALNETYIYYRDLDAGHEKHEEKEAQLVKYWSAAAIPMRHIDQEFAEICEYKSQYWLNPDQWSDEKIREFKIGLYDVRENYRRKLIKTPFVNKVR